MADGTINAARAFLGQGLGMGWGDEGEAWLRSKLGGKPYEQALQQIRQEYAKYARENPATAMAAEFAGGMAPAVGMMFVPGAQPAAVAQAQRSTVGALGRLAALGGATGAVSGAGSATEGERGTGAIVGGTLGTAIGGGAPVVLRGVQSAGQVLRNKYFPTEATIASRAGERMTSAMRQSDLTPQQIEQMMAKDRAMGVPSTLANVDAAMATLAEAVAQRTGKGTLKVEKTLTQQKTGSRERTYQQIEKGLQPGDYYADEARLVKELRDKANTLYDDAYAWGDVDDPKILRIMDTPELKSAFQTARKIADAQKSLAKIRGEDPSKFDLPEIYKPSGKFTEDGAEILELARLPDVRTLDFMKRGLDAQINAGFKSSDATVMANAATLKEIRNELRDTLKDVVPPYRQALKTYAGDMEVIDAMRAGMSEFGKLKPEQLAKMFSEMGDAEKEAFRTGAARKLYSDIVETSKMKNAAQEIINNEATVKKIDTLFDDPAYSRLFKAALEREGQLFQQANQILGNSRTQKRKIMDEEFEESPSVSQAMVQGALGNFSGALSGLATRFANSATITPQVADKLADMLMAKNPSEVGAVVKFLEDYAAGQVPKAVKSTAGERGAVMGTTTSIFNPPAVEGETGGGIETEMPKMSNAPEGESELEREWRKMQAPQENPPDTLE